MQSIGTLQVHELLCIRIRRGPTTLCFQISIQKVPFVYSLETMRTNIWDGNLIPILLMFPLTAVDLTGNGSISLVKM